MKKLISLTILSSFLLIGTPVYAQETADQPTQYLPQKGDYAIGIDVIPLLRTIGGAFNQNDEVPVGGTPFNSNLFLKPNVSFLGKYMLTNKWALRLNVGLAFKNQTNKAYAADDLGLYLNPNSGAKVVDSEKINQFGGSAMFGAEYRVGSKRVQGIMGFGVLLAGSSASAKYTYGNAITELNQYPTTAFTPDVPGYNAYPGFRITEVVSGNPNFTMGAYASAGVEWFVAPKIALGASVDLSLYGTMSSKGWVKSQGFNEVIRRSDTRTDLCTPGNNSFNFGTDNIGGALYMTYYFR